MLFLWFLYIHAYSYIYICSSAYQKLEISTESEEFAVSRAVRIDRHVSAGSDLETRPEGVEVEVGFESGWRCEWSSK